MKITYCLIVVGAGGTGSFFLEEAGRLLCHHRRKGDIYDMHIFDGDEVAVKNLERQCFLDEDIGRNKAAVLSEVLNEAFNLKFVAHNCYITEMEQLKVWDKRIKSIIPVIVSCVDNHACRLVIEELYNEVDSIIVFDAANEYETGEVVFSYKRDGKVYSPCRSHFFPDILKGELKKVTDMSCEEMNAVTPQHMLTNRNAASHLCTALANLLEGRTTPGFTMFNPFRYQSTFYPYKGGT